MLVVESIFKNYGSVSKTIDEFNKRGYKYNITVVIYPE
jgi:hypothetical protein